MDDARRATTQRARCDEIGFGRNPSRAIRCFLRATYNFHLLSMFAFLSCVSHTWIYTRKPFRAYFSPALFASYHRSSAQPSSASSSPAEYTRHVHHSSRTLHLAVLPSPPDSSLFLPLLVLARRIDDDDEGVRWGLPPLSRRRRKSPDADAWLPRRRRRR